MESSDEEHRDGAFGARGTCWYRPFFTVLVACFCVGQLGTSHWGTVVVAQQYVYQQYTAWCTVILLVCIAQRASGALWYVAVVA